MIKITIKGSQGEGTSSIASIIFNALKEQYKISVIDGEDEYDEYDNLCYIGFAQTEKPQIEIKTNKGEIIC